MSSEEEMSRDNEENEEEEEENSDTQEVNNTKSAAKGRGRPPKKMYNEEEDSDTADVSKSKSSSSGRGRGRPPKKMYKEDDDNEEDDDDESGKAHSENEHEDEEDDDDDYSGKVTKSPGRGRGRPKGRGRGTPAKGKGRGTSAKGRGRPPGKAPTKHDSEDDDDNDSRTRKGTTPAGYKGYKEDSESDEWEPEPELEEPSPKRKKGSGRPRKVTVSEEDSDMDFRPGYQLKKKPKGAYGRAGGRVKGSGRRKKDADIRDLICELGQVFYQLGWVSGTGGGISIKFGDNILVAPSGVQKERLQPEDMFVLDDQGDIVESPRGDLKKSQCTPLFLLAFNKKSAGAVIHSHSKAAVLATLRFSGPEFKISHVEMIKGIKHGTEDRQMRYNETVVVPIIENTPFEADLEDSMAKAMEQYPDTNAILVRRHGVYVWGETWEMAKTMAESYDYLFDLAVQMTKFDLDPCKVPEVVKENGN